NRLRRVCDRRKGHYGNHGRDRLASALAPDVEEIAVRHEPVPAPQAEEPVRTPDDESYAPPEPVGILPIAMEGDGPAVLREKAHKADPMTIDQALFEMELVGHDFYLFRDKESGRPSVVYRRRGWDYGVIRLIEE